MQWKPSRIHANRRMEARTDRYDSFREYTHPPKRVGGEYAEGKAVYTCHRLHYVL